MVVLVYTIYIDGSRHTNAYYVKFILFYVSDVMMMAVQSVYMVVYTYCAAVILCISCLLMRYDLNMNKIMTDPRMKDLCSI